MCVLQLSVLGNVCIAIKCIAGVSQLQKIVSDLRVRIQGLLPSKKVVFYLLQ